MHIRVARSEEEVREAAELAKSVLKLKDQHRDDFLRYCQRCYQEYSALFVIAEEDGNVTGVALGSVEGDHIKIGEMAVAEAYRRQGTGSSVLALLEKHGQQAGFTRFLLGATDNCYSFYLKNGYAPELYFTVENTIDTERFDAYLAWELHRYPLIWKQHDQYGSHAIVKTPFPDVELLHRVEQALPTCKAQYLFFKDKVKR